MESTVAKVTDLIPEFLEDGIIKMVSEEWYVCSEQVRVHKNSDDEWFTVDIYEYESDEHQMRTHVSYLKVLDYLFKELKGLKNEVGS